MLCSSASDTQDPSTQQHYPTHIVYIALIVGDMNNQIWDRYREYQRVRRLRHSSPAISDTRHAALLDLFPNHSGLFRVSPSHCSSSLRVCRTDKGRGQLNKIGVYREEETRPALRDQPPGVQPWTSTHTKPPYRNQFVPMAVINKVLLNMPFMGRDLPPKTSSATVAMSDCQQNCL